MRLRERKIGPYKYPTIDRTKEGKDPEKKQSNQPRKAEHTKHNPKKNTESRTETSTQNRVKNQKKTEHKPKNIYTEKERKAEGSHGSALFSSLQENN